jgi:hypothetical protein
MRYKTIVLELLKERPRMHEELRKRRLLLAAVEAYSMGLKTSHEAWKRKLAETRPAGEPQIASEALELALKELEGSLPSESPADGETLSLDEAMAFIRRHTPPA